MVSLKGKDNPNYRTGYKMKGNVPSFYNSWQAMKQRCLNPKNPKYVRYGARGIKICDEWLTIEGFSSWALNNGWEEGLTIDRIDNNGNYCPENCRWVSVSENSRKKSTTKLTDFDAEKIRNYWDSGFDIKTLSKMFDCTEGNIWFIINNVTHVEDNQCTKRIKQIRMKKLK